MAGGNTLTFTDANFEPDVLRSDVPVLVDFWADGCRPCAQLAPVIDMVAGEYVGKMKIGKLDVVPNNDTASRYKVRSVPTLLLFKGGAVIDQRVGALSKSELKKMIDPHMSPAD